MLKRNTLLSLFLLFLVILVTACGSAGTASPTSSTSESHSTATRAPVQGQTVQVTLVEYRITSSITTFHVGRLYHFVVTNRGTVAHELMIMPPTGDSVSMSKMIASSLIYIDFINPGQTHTTDYTFTKPNAHLEFACHFTGRQANDSHYDMGMHLSIIVE